MSQREERCPLIRKMREWILHRTEELWATVNDVICLLSHIWREFARSYQNFLRRCNEMDKILFTKIPKRLRQADRHEENMS